MKKLIITSIMAILMINMAFALSLTREFPSEAATSGAFNMDLKVTGSSGNYSLVYTIDITGGCKSIAGNTHITGGFMDEADSTNTLIINAPLTAGTCTFTGGYQLGSGTEPPITAFPIQSVSIVGTSCVPTTW